MCFLGMDLKEKDLKTPQKFCLYFKDNQTCYQSTVWLSKLMLISFQEKNPSEGTLL